MKYSLECSSSLSPEEIIESVNIAELENGEGPERLQFGGAEIRESLMNNSAPHSFDLV